MSRSSTMVLMFLMRGEGMTLLEAWTLAKELRSLILPNPKFAIALCNYELTLFGKNTMSPI